MVLLRKLNNADAGTSTRLGGNDTDKLADYFNDINVSETPRINNPTEYRSGILKIRDGSNAFNVTIKSATQTADRDYTIPPLIGNDSPAALGVANIFTQAQQITLDADTLFNLYRPVSTTNSLNSIGFFHRNSSNASTKYASIASQIITNTNALEDGKLKFFVKKAGVDTEVMSIDKNGLLTVTSVSTGGGTAYAATDVANTFTQIQTISSDNQRLLKLYRPTNIATNIVGLEMDHRNSSNAQIEFGRIVTQLVTNTAGAEDGKFIFSLVKGGVMTEVASMDKNGLLTVASISTGGGGVGITVLKNSGVSTTTASSTAEFDLLNYSVPANTLGANGSLRVRVLGYILQNTASSVDFTLKIKFGTTISYQDSILAASMPQSAANKPFVLEFSLGNKNSTSAQAVLGTFLMQDSAAATTGEGTINEDEQTSTAVIRGVDLAKATTSAQTLQVTMTMSVSNASISTTVTRQTIEFIPGV